MTIETPTVSARQRRFEPGVIPLQSGDRLTRAEFERRYDAHPEIKKAELIEGVVYVASPVHNQSGLLQSEIFPGLWLDPRAFWQGEMARLLEVLNQGLQSEEHAAFAARLKEEADDKTETS